MRNNSPNPAIWENQAYPVFEPNQLLTSQQLNALGDFQNRQNRMTRVYLIGTGIVCGLDVIYISASKKITISEGIGVTSHGYQVNFPKKDFTHYADFSIPDSYFSGKCLQLFTTGEAPASAQQIGASLENMVVVLYVEINDKNLENCVGDNCDDKGIERSYIFRPLLVERSAALQKLLKKSDTFSTDEFETEEQKCILKSQQRFDRDFVYSTSLQLFPKNDNLLITLDKLIGLTERYNRLFLSDELVNLGKKIETLHTDYSPLFDNLFVPTRATEIPTEHFKTLLRKTKQAPTHFQYFYDYIKDIALAYNELISEAFDVGGVCCPDEEAFPKHLFLGQVKSDQDICKPDIYRASFYQPLVYNVQHQQVALVKSLYIRLMHMIYSYKVPASGKIMLTLSNEKQAPLALRSIPFYYELTSGEGSVLKSNWNFELGRRCKTKWNTAGANLLSSHKDRFNFYRIEDILGVDYPKVEKRLNELKKEFHLDFEVLALKLEESEKLSEHTEKYVMTDLKEDYLQLRNRIIATVRQHDLALRNLSSLLANPGRITSFLFDRNTTLTYTGPDFSAALIGSLPVCLFDFDDKKLLGFRDAYNNFVRFIFEIAAGFEAFLRQSARFGDTSRPDPGTGAMQYVLERVLANCGFSGGTYSLLTLANTTWDSELCTLYHSYTLRKERLREEIDTFLGFAKRHPGLEHMAGVPKGGTFILVYENDQKKAVVADFALSGKIGLEESFPLCESRSQFPPVARPVYYLLDDYSDGKILIDVLAHCVELNVMQLRLKGAGLMPGAANHPPTYTGTSLPPYFSEEKIHVQVITDKVQYNYDGEEIDQDSIFYTITNKFGTDSNKIYIFKMPGITRITPPRGEGQGQGTGQGRWTPGSKIEGYVGRLHIAGLFGGADADMRNIIEEIEEKIEVIVPVPPKSPGDPSPIDEKTYVTTVRPLMQRLANEMLIANDGLPQGTTTYERMKVRSGKNAAAAAKLDGLSTVYNILVQTTTDYAIANSKTIKSGGQLFTHIKNDLTNQGKLLKSRGIRTDLSTALPDAAAQMKDPAVKTLFNGFASF